MEKEFDVFGPELVAAAWLHDVLEDTTVTKEFLSGAGIPYSVGKLVVAVTRNKEEETYKQFITRICQSETEAIILKIADIWDNINREGCPEGMKETRYLPALRLLRAELMSRN